MTSVEKLQYIFDNIEDIESFWLLSLGDMRSKDPLEPQPILRADYQHQLFDFMQNNAVKPYEMGSYVKCFRRGSILEWCVAPNDVEDHPAEIRSLRHHLSECLVSVTLEWMSENLREGSSSVTEEQIESLIGLLRNKNSDEDTAKILIHPSLEELCTVLVEITLLATQHYINLCSVPHVCDQESFLVIGEYTVPKIQERSIFEDGRKQAIVKVTELLNNLRSL